MPGSHTAETISESLLEVLNEFELSNKIVSIVADNAKNGLKGTQIVNTYFNNSGIAAHLVVQFGCVCHIINLIVKKLTKNFGRSH